jgi:ABC-type multidrug transport system ATPase subunit
VVAVQKVIFVPGITYYDLLLYAARLRLKSSDMNAIKARVSDVLTVMDLMHCRNRKIEESPSLRGVGGGELR